LEFSGLRDSGMDRYPRPQLAAENYFYYLENSVQCGFFWVAVLNAKNHKRQRRKRQSVTAKREKSQTPKV